MRSTRSKSLALAAALLAVAAACATRPAAAGQSPSADIFANLGVDADAAGTAANINTDTDTGPQAQDPQALQTAPPTGDDAAAAMRRHYRPAEKFGAGLFSTDDKWEWRLTFAPDRRRAFWTSSDGWFPGTRTSSIITSEWRRGAWSAPETASFSGVYTDIDPFIAPDGQTLFFSSIRPVHGETRTDLDIWMVRRTRNGWSDPVHLGANINSSGDELYPSVDAWGTLYFGRWKENGDWDIFRSRRRWNGTYEPAEPLGAGVNSDEHWEFNPEISPDGRTLLFTRLESFTGAPWGNLRVSRVRANGSVTASEPLNACVNTDADEYHPTMLWEQGLLIFARNRDPLAADSNGDFYAVRIAMP